MNYLITGGFGFIGNNYIRRMAVTAPENNYIIFDKISYCSDTSVLKEFSNVSHASNLSVVLDALKIDALIHFAAETSVDRSFDDPQLFFQENTHATFDLLQLCKNYLIDKIIIMSTDEVYGDVKDDRARTENDALNPSNPYAASKAAADQFALMSFNCYQQPIIIIRCCNVYGPFQHQEKVIPAFIQSCIRDESLHVHGDGSSKRMFIHVDDVIDAINMIIARGRLGEIYNISSDFEISIIDLAKILTKKIGGGNISFAPDRKVNDSRYLINSNKLKQLGWTPYRSFHNVITNVIEWYKSSINK